MYGTRSHDYARSVLDGLARVLCLRVRYHRISWIGNKPLGPTKMLAVPGNSADYGPISIATDVANEVVVMMPINDQGGSSAKWTAPPGMIEHADNGTLAFFDETRVNAGQADSRIATTSAADHCGAVEMVGVRPAP